MGLTGHYIMISEDTLDRLIAMDEEALALELAGLDEADRDAVFNLGEYWDGLHFLLTGSPASEPDGTNPLSMAVIGARPVEIPDENHFLAYTGPEDLPGIVAALEGVDLDDLGVDFAPSRYARARVYPEIWTEGEPEAHLSALADALEGLTAFYRQAETRDMHVIISIH